MAALPDIVSYRANLIAAEFPFLSELQGRSVILPGVDQEAELGQAYYMHNVVPTQRGYGTVAYNVVLQAPADQDGTFSKVFQIRSPTGQRALFSRTSSGRNYTAKSTDPGWTRTTDIAMPSNGFVSSAYVNGVTYICFGYVNIYKYDFATNTLSVAATTGLDPTKVKGIFASNGYMLAYTDAQVVWSSTTDPTDFIPSAVTGAGGGNIQNVKATITYCAPQNTGFIVYTQENAVSASYSGNASFPFGFKEVQGSGGVASDTYVSVDGNNGSHIAYTTNGVQKITANLSEILYPELTDFIAGKQFEDYNEITKEFSSVPLLQPMQKKVTVVANRYFVMSYGVSGLTHALMYDLALNRWGKFKFTHVDCFEYKYPFSDKVDAPKGSIGFLAPDGRLSTAVMSYETAGSFGVILLGKYQLDRNRLSSIQEIVIENIKYGNNLFVELLSSLNGITLSPYIPYLAESAGLSRKYNSSVVGMNHSLLIQGSFSLQTLTFKFIDEGDS